MLFILLILNLLLLLTIIYVNTDKIFISITEKRDIDIPVIRYIPPEIAKKLKNIKIKI